MTRLMKILSIAGLSSVYLMDGACTMSGDGFSFIPSFNLVIATLLRGLTT